MPKPRPQGSRMGHGGGRLNLGPSRKRGRLEPARQGQRHGLAPLSSSSLALTWSNAVTAMARTAADKSCRGPDASAAMRKQEGFKLNIPPDPTRDARPVVGPAVEVGGDRPSSRRPRKPDRYARSRSGLAR